LPVRYGIEKRWLRYRHRETPCRDVRPEDRAERGRLEVAGVSYGRVALNFFLGVAAVVLVLAAGWLLFPLAGVLLASNAFGLRDRLVACFPAAGRFRPLHLALSNAVGEGLHQARQAAQCLTDDDPQHHTVLQLMAYLSTSIERLQAARAMVQRRA
jgi:hypothetical protein